MASTLTIMAVIRGLAGLYGVDPELALCICRRESSFNNRAVGDEGKAVGLWQWHKPSWDHVRRSMDLSTLDHRANIVESTEAAMYAMSVLGLHHWWSTFEGCRQEISGRRALPPETPPP